MPGPLVKLRDVQRRTLRSVPHTASVVVLFISLLVSSLLTQSAQLRVSEAIDDDWRGLYDILVLPPDAELSSCRQPGSSATIAPNFVGFAASSGLHPEDLDALRAIDGVDVAAPIGLVGSLASSSATVNGVYPSAEDLGRAVVTTTARLTLDDGQAPRTVNEVTTAFHYADDDDDPRLISPNAPVVLTSSSPRLTDPIVSSGRLVVPLLHVPAPPTVVAAIDPTAEMRLLGHPDGALERLRRSEALDLSVVDLDGSSDGRKDDAAMWDLRATVGPEDLVPQVAGIPLDQEDTAYLPLVVVERDEPRMQLDVETRILPAEAPLAMAEDDGHSRDDSSGGSVERTSRDVSSWSTPLTTRYREGLVFQAGAEPLPGNEMLAAAGGTLVSLLPSYPQPPDFDTPDASRSCDLAAEPQGETRLSADLQGFVPSATDYLEQTYRRTTPVEPEDHLIPFPLAYLEDGIIETARQAKVPLGAYHSVETRIIADPSGRSPDPDRSSLLPQLTGLDMLGSPPSALTTLEGGRRLRGDATIDAVRIRVAGIGDFSGSAQTEIAKVAAEVEDLGFRAVVVAGSSAESVSIQMPDYFVAGRPSTTADPPDLGTVAQDWVSLDVASQLVRTADTTGLALLGILGGTGLSLGWLGAWSGARSRRQDDALLEELGWSRGRRLWWAARPYLVGALLLFLAFAAIAGIQSLRGADMPYLVPAGVAVASGYAMLSLAAVLLGRRSDRPHALRHDHPSTALGRPAANVARRGRARRRAALTGSASLAGLLRHARPVALGIDIAAAALCGVCAAFVAGTLANALDSAGASLLAGSATAASGSLYLFVGGLACAAALAFLLICHLSERSLWRQRLRLLSDAGWTGRAQRAWLAHYSIPVAAAAPLSAGLLILIAPPLGWPVLLTALVAAMTATGAAVGQWRLRVREVSP